MRAVFLGASLAVCTLGAQAETSKELAVQNATYLTTLLLAVDSAQASRMLAKISEGKIGRPAPDQPVWILNSEQGAILYYQGQPGFAGQPATALLDDDGMRFGLKAIERAKAARSGWLALKLGAKRYSAYCQAKTPFVVCSLVP